MAIQGNQIEIQFVSEGADKIEADLRALGNLSSQAAKELAGLSKTLGVSTGQAAKLSQVLGLGGKELDNLVKRYRYLKDAGATAEQTFSALNRELGISEKQYRELESVLGQVATAQKEQADAANEAANASAAQVLALQELNSVAGQLATAFQGLAGAALNEFIAFDDAFTSVKAKAGATEEQLQSLRQAILDVAASTGQGPVAAAEAADAYIALGATAEEAGRDLIQIARLTDALRSTGATTEEAGTVIRLGTQLFRDFGVTAEDVANKVALIGDISNVQTLNEFLQVFSKAGGVAATLGIGIDELLAQFAVLRDAGQAPEVAATSLKSLYGVVLDNQDTIKELGVDVLSADGKFRGLTEIIGDLGKAGVTTTQIVELFGARGVASAIALSTEYEKTITFTEILASTTDDLARKSAIVNESLGAQIKLLQSGLSVALAEVGKTIGQFTGPAVAEILELLKVFAEAPPIVKQFVGSIVGIGALLTTATVAVTTYTLALKAWQAAQVGAALAESRTAIATAAGTAAKVLATAATQQLTLAQGFNAVSSGVAAAATTGLTAATAGLGVALGGLQAALLAVGPALAVLAAGLAALDVLKSGIELKKLNAEIDTLSKGAAAFSAASLKVAEGLKNTNAEILAQQEKGVDADQKSLDLQKQKMELARRTIADLDAELKIRQELLKEIEAAGKGQTDVPILAGMTRDALEAQRNAISGQVGELLVAKRLLQEQLKTAVALQGAQRNLGGAAGSKTEDPALKAYQQSRQQAEDDYNDSRKRAQADYARERQRSETDFREKQARDLDEFHADRLSAERDFREKAADDAENFQRKQDADLEKFNADRVKAERDFREKELADSETFQRKQAADLEKFNADRAKAESQFQSQRATDLENFNKQQSDREVQFAQQASKAKTDFEKQQIQELADFRQRLEDERRAEEESAVDREIRRRTDLALATDDEERAALEAKYAEEDALLAKRIAAEKAASAEVEAERREVVGEAAARGEFDQTATEQRRNAEELAALKAKQAGDQATFEEQQRIAAEDFATQQQTARAEFEAQQQAAAAAFATQQQEAEAEFNTQQQTAEAEFAASQQQAAATFAREQQEAQAEFTASQQAAEEEFTASQEQAAKDFARQQQEAEKEFTDGQRNAQRDFAREQRQKQEDFAIKQRQDEQDFQKEQQRREAAFKEEQRKKDLENAEEAAAIAGGEGAEGTTTTTEAVPVAARRHGGPVQAGTPYLVGEAGPELLVPKTNGVILPNPVTQRILAQSPGGLPSGVVNNAGLLREINAGIRDLQATIANRPIQFNEGSFTAVNAPDPLAAQIALTQAKLKALRGAV